MPTIKKTTAEDLRNFLYPLCRSRRKTLESLPVPISISDLNSIEEMDRIIEELEKNLDHNDLKTVVFLFRCKARRNELYYKVGSSSTTELPSTGSG